MIAELDRITQAARTPHGYTLALWAAGAFCVGRHSVPSPLAISLFVVAGTAALGAIRLLIAGRRIRVRRDPAGCSVHLIALPGAMLASWQLAALPTPWCWPASSSSATIIYLVLHSSQDALWGRLRAGSGSPGHDDIRSTPDSSAASSAPLSS